MKGHELIDFVETENTKEITKEKIDESVPIKIEEVEKPLPRTIDDISMAYWGYYSQQYLDAYKYGVGIGTFGKNVPSIYNVFCRLSESIITSIKNQLNNENKSTENFSCHFAVLESIMKLLAKEIEGVHLKKSNHIDFLASQHGFLETIIKNMNGSI